MASLTPSSHIHIHTYPTPIFTSAPVPEKTSSTATTAEAPKETTPAAASATTPTPPTKPTKTTTVPSSHLSTPQLLAAPLSLIPPSALAAKATSTKTTGAASKPVITQEGPVHVEPLPGSKPGRKNQPTADGKPAERPKTKNGYLPPGTSLASAASAKEKDRKKADGKKKRAGGKEEEEDDDDGDDDDNDGGKKKWVRYEVLESRISTTVQALEGGGKRTVWVRTDREVTVLIEPAEGQGKEERMKKK